MSYSCYTFNDGFYESLENELERCEVCKNKLFICQFNTRYVQDNLEVVYLVQSRLGKFQCRMGVRSRKDRTILYVKRSDIVNTKLFSIENVINKIGLRKLGCEISLEGKVCFKEFFSEEEFNKSLH